MAGSIVQKLKLIGVPSFTKPRDLDPVLRLLIYVVIAVVLFCIFADLAFADVARLPGVDESSKLEAAGTLLRLIDTGLFKWGARIFAGICIMSAGWALKEQRFGIAIICVIGAIIFGTAPTWVKNIFEIGGGNGVFSKMEEITSRNFVVAATKAKDLGNSCIAI